MNQNPCFLSMRTLSNKYTSIPRSSESKHKERNFCLMTSTVELWFLLVILLWDWTIYVFGVTSVPKYGSFSFRISPSNEYSGLILNIEYSGWPLSMGLFKDVIFKKQLEVRFEQLNFLWKIIRIVYKTLWKCIPDTKVEFGLSLCMLVIGTQIIGELFIFKPGSLEDK